ncbi:helix-turn-helix domain-containing protein [Robiginitalea sediminis]|uniref:helix-turn-helix domain-containing protein n=1 Tax=Robiginitalea sediminis TaxID=1982593 RepID=UPI0018E936A5|nr:helix-turn-helix domain-containing protein [Robiginitalea sediminis]
MFADALRVTPIFDAEMSYSTGDVYNLIWIQRKVKEVEIDGYAEAGVDNALYFLDARTRWRIAKGEEEASAGYVLTLPRRLMEHPTLKNLHIAEIRLLAHDQIPKITLAPGIAIRIQAIIEMLDELAGSELNHREEAMASLVKTLFVYTDGQCNIRSTLTENNAKKQLVFRFKKLVDSHSAEVHEVADYARKLNVSAKYLNSCTREVLGTTAKSLIDEIRIMRSRHLLKFSDLTIKEISYALGFSSQDYFSYFLKKHTGLTPSTIRKG